MYTKEEEKFMDNDEKFGTLEVKGININIDELSDDELSKMEEEIIRNKSDYKKNLDEILEIQ